jgi:protein-tyrosine phosphatase
MRKSSVSRPTDHHFDRYQGVILHVLFVCTGNICRSPIAERLSAKWATQMNVHGFSASSAGTRAVIGHPIHPHAMAALEALGGDPSDFAARQLTPKIALSADLILTMTRAHRDVVLELAPRQLQRTFTLSEAARLASQHSAQSISDLATLRPHLSSTDTPDIADPIGQNAEFHSVIAEEIATLLTPVLNLCIGSVDSSS